MAGIRITNCGPGLAGAWHRGLLPSLAVAVLAAWMASFLMLATFVWPEWIGVGWLRLGWLLGLVGWVSGLIHNAWSVAAWTESGAGEPSNSLETAQREYLRGNWFESEAILLDGLQRHPRDAEMLLLLAGVLRQTRRWQPALRRLQQLELLDSATSWRFEIAREKKLIAQKMEEELQTPAATTCAPEDEQTE